MASRNGKLSIVPDGAADLADDHVVPFGHVEDAPFDLVGDVRDHLHGSAEVFAFAFVGDDSFVHLAGGEVVFLRHARRQEALVVAEVPGRSQPRRR